MPMNDFKHFSEMPPEIQMLVVDEMGPDDRCRFSGLSKLCNKLAKYSKSYMKALALHIGSESFVKIVVTHGDVDLGYILEFGVEGENRYMKYKNMEKKELWKINIGSDVVQCAVQYFKNLLQLHQNKIEALHINTGIFDIEIDNDFEIRRLNKLTQLSILGDLNSQQFISKTRLPLKNLGVQRDYSSTIHKEQMYQVQDVLYYPDLELSNEEMLRLAARRVCIHIGDLTVRDIFNFIRSWQNGTIGRRVRMFDWNIRGTEFDVQELFSLLGRVNYSENSYFKQAEIPHDTLSGRHAMLYCGCGSFNVVFPEFDSPA